MKSEAKTPEEYIEQLPGDRKDAIRRLREVIKINLPAGFEEMMSYGMIGFVVPKSLYPAGYHCTPKLPLPFLNIASQKNFIAIYHMALYADKELYNWFITEYAKVSKTKPDVGKSCTRFKKVSEIPFDLIGELASKMTPEQWIEMYESNFKNSK